MCIRDRVSRLCREHGALLVLDTAQTAGVLPIDLTDVPVDVLCFTGHKGLLGPQGTGGLVLSLIHISGRVDP